MTLPRLKCTRCEHEWIPRADQGPKRCPVCKSPYWDRPRSAAWGKLAKKRTGDRDKTTNTKRMEGRELHLFTWAEAEKRLDDFELKKRNRRSEKDP